ncbi:MAG: DNA repair exonuclease [Candidatus Micrarchaeota archaeon]
MRIAIVSDLHLGYPRFEEDSYVQAERALIDASDKADLILCAGDVFDVKIPKLETLKRAVEIFGKATVLVYAIFGNHERRAKDLVNPVHLLEASTGIKLLHGVSGTFEKDGERVQILGIGSVPEEYAEEAVRQVMARFVKEEGAFRILMIHQSLKELVPGGKDELSLEYVESLPFDLIIDGHIHETITKLDGRFLIPGSTVITQLKREEMKPKGYFLYDTKTRKSEFVKIASRPFFYEELDFKDAGEADVRERVRVRVSELKRAHPEAVIAVKIDGTLKEGLSSSDIKVDGYEDVYIENRLNAENLGAKLERIKLSMEASLSMREVALKELRAKTEGKVTLFDSTDLFDKLLMGPEETLAYLEKYNKK